MLFEQVSIQQSLCIAVTPGYILLYRYTYYYVHKTNHERLYVELECRPPVFECVKKMTNWLLCEHGIGTSHVNILIIDTPCENILTIGTPSENIYGISCTWSPVKFPLYL